MFECPLTFIFVIQSTDFTLLFVCFPLFRGWRLASRKAKLWQGHGRLYSRTLWVVASYLQLICTSPKTKCIYTNKSTKLSGKIISVSLCFTEISTWLTRRRFMWETHSDWQGCVISVNLDQSCHAYQWHRTCENFRLCQTQLFGSFVLARCSRDQ